MSKAQHLETRLTLLGMKEPDKERMRSAYHCIVGNLRHGLDIDGEFMCFYSSPCIYQGKEYAMLKDQCSWDVHECLFHRQKRCIIDVLLESDL